MIYRCEVSYGYDGIGRNKEFEADTLSKLKNKIKDYFGDGIDCHIDYISEVEVILNEEQEAKERFNKFAADFILKTNKAKF